jgi:hypothetical protein
MSGNKIAREMLAKAKGSYLGGFFSCKTALYASNPYK